MYEGIYVHQFVLFFGDNLKIAIYDSEGDPRFTDLVIEKKLRREDMKDLSDFVTEKYSLTGDEKMPIIFSNSGIVLEDIALACAVYERARAGVRGAF